ncbi:hypothetical protein G7075_13485 [Phycicoccus sp. HDW14]|uniref:hypothetical protein n=1 Tax=Phycicoccus sp. HDW14 TaxID=2714941 RepID=UPI00140C7D0B|nr:hypothetical protein [Phycicoccus sp. HDW14]QIM21900.1 hypothetical protein G7075_13485 [Phycicoccus sp. HDW14]
MVSRVHGRFPPVPVPPRASSSNLHATSTRPSGSARTLEDETKEMVPMMNGFVGTGWVMWLVMGSVVTALWALVVLAVVALVRPGARAGVDESASQDVVARR